MKRIVKRLAAIVAVLALGSVLAYGEELKEVKQQIAKYLPSSYTFFVTPEFIQSVPDDQQQCLLWLYYASDQMAKIEALLAKGSKVGLQEALKAYQEALAQFRAELEAALKAGKLPKEVADVIAKAIAAHKTVMGEVAASMPAEALAALEHALQEAASVYQAFVGSGDYGGGSGYGSGGGSGGSGGGSGGGPGYGTPPAPGTP